MSSQRRDREACQGLESFFRKKRGGEFSSNENLCSEGIEKLLSDLLLKKGAILGRMSRYVKGQNRSFAKKGLDWRDVRDVKVFSYFYFYSTPTF